MGMRGLNVADSHIQSFSQRNERLQTFLQEVILNFSQMRCHARIQTLPSTYSLKTLLLLLVCGTTSPFSLEPDKIEQKLLIFAHFSSLHIGDRSVKQQHIIHNSHVSPSVLELPNSFCTKPLTVV